jgi:hypothetical protein
MCLVWLACLATHRRQRSHACPLVSSVCVCVNVSLRRMLSIFHPIPVRISPGWRKHRWNSRHLSCRQTTTSTLVVSVVPENVCLHNNVTTINHHVTAPVRRRLEMFVKKPCGHVVWTCIPLVMRRIRHPMVSRISGVLVTPRSSTGKRTVPNQRRRRSLLSNLPRHKIVLMTS